MSRPLPLLLCMLPLLARPAPAAQESPSSAAAADDADAAGFSIAGTVRDARTDAPLAAATVVARVGSRRYRATTGDDGRYRLTVPAREPLRLTVRRIGYTTLRLELQEIDEETDVDFVLVPRPVALAPLVMEARARSRGLAALDAAAPGPAEPDVSGPPPSAVERGLETDLARLAHALAPTADGSAGGPQ
ncbi:MAG: carboxypeptidase-like regulatory domain-containing protein, partial [Gemmatimonadota bacterium]